LVLLSACVSDGALTLSDYGKMPTRPERFSICRGYGCPYTDKVSLSDAEWREVTKPLRVKAKTPEEERRHIARYIAGMEKIVGKKTGTDTDREGATFFGHDEYQLDCIDETVNTSRYLGLVEKEGLLVWHKMVAPLRRGDLVDGRWPHNTASIEEKATGKRYTVDSWFFANGEEPVMIPAEQWMAGWRP